MDYDTLRDFEINKAVTRICYPTSSEFQNGEGESIWFRCGRYNDHKDYCNNPADAWPIILANKINIYFSNNDNLAQFYQYGKESVEHADGNPLRAAMIVFLKMQESANVQDNPAR